MRGIKKGGRGRGVLWGVVGGWLSNTQHGPVQVEYCFRSLIDLSPEHLTWSQSEQVVHCIAYGESLRLHILQYQTGPGFCSMPARINRSRIRLDGVVLIFVNQLKNTV